VSQFRNTNWWVCHLTTCFLRVRSIIFILIYRQAWCIAWIFTRPKVTKPETETLHLQDRDETETFQKNVLRPLRDRDIQDRDYIPAWCIAKKLKETMLPTCITTFTVNSTWVPSQCKPIYFAFATCRDNTQSTFPHWNVTCSVVAKWTIWVW